MNSVLQYARSSNIAHLPSNPSYTDTNNNNNKVKKISVTHHSEKYSLRPRLLRRKLHQNIDEVISTDVNPQEKEIKIRQKIKQKPAPLSKYRRRTANARERGRMQEINAAFEALRRAVPHLQQCTTSSASQNEKLTKITTLRLAMKYISMLSAALRENTSSTMEFASWQNGETDLCDLLSDFSNLDGLSLESDCDSILLQSDQSDHSVTSGKFLTDFAECSFANDFVEHSLSPTFNNQSLSPFEPFFIDFT